MRTFNQRFAEFFDLAPQSEIAGAEAYLNLLTVRWLRAVAILMTVSVLALWPTDLYIFRNRPDYQSALAMWRTALASATLLLALGFTYSAKVRRHPVWAFCLAAVVVMFASGLAVGRLGGIDNPFFYAVYPIPATTVALLVALRERIMAAATIGVSYLAGFLTALYPQLPDISFLGPVIFLIASSIGMVFIGHVVYRLVGSNFARRERLAQLVESQKLDLALATREALTAHETVRASVLRDLHDNVGPIITSLDLNTYATREKFRVSDQLPDPNAYFDDVDEHSKALKEIIRATLQDLDPHGIARGKLTEVLAGTLDDMALVHGHQVSCTLDETLNELSTDIKQSLHYIVRECVNNTLKHANAKSIRLQAGILDGVLYCSYDDDGKGTPLSPEVLGDEHGRFGLSGIRLRAINLGGGAAFSSSPNKGFSVKLRIPLMNGFGATPS